MRLRSSSAIALVLLSPCFAIPGCDPPPLTREEAIAKAERVFRDYINKEGYDRSDFEAPVVQRDSDGVLVGFRRHDTATQGAIVGLAKNGCVGLSPEFGPLFDDGK